MTHTMKAKGKASLRATIGVWLQCWDEAMVRLIGLGARLGAL